MFLLHTCLQPALLLGEGCGCRGDWELLADSDWEAAGAEGAAGSAQSAGTRVPGRQGRGRGLGAGCWASGGPGVPGARGGTVGAGHAELRWLGAAASSERFLEQGKDAPSWPCRWSGTGAREEAGLC